MGIRSRLSLAWNGLRGRTTTLTASIVDPDEDEGWSLLGGSRYAGQHTNIRPMTYMASLRMSDHLAQTSLMAHAYLGNMADMTIGDGLSYSLGKKAAPAAVQVVEEFWKRNDMENRLGRMAEATSRTGERVIPVAVDENNGDVMLGSIHPQHVEKIHFQEYADIPATVFIRERGLDGQVESKPYQVVREVTEGAQVKGELDGDLFLWQINRTENQERGYSDLLTMSDWLEAHDEFLFVGLDRAKIQNNVFFHMIVEGADEAALRKYAREFQHPPAPGTTRVTNSKVTIQAVSPEIAANEMHQHHRTIKEHLVTGTRMPSHWYGSGEDANRASAAEMGMPALKMLRSRRALYFGELRKIVFFVLHAKMRAGLITPADVESVDLTFQAPELEDSKIGAQAAAIRELMQAVTVALKEGLISSDVAKRVLVVVLSEIGVDYDPEEDLKALEQEIAERRKRQADDLENAITRARSQTAPGRTPNDDPKAGDEESRS